MATTISGPAGPITSHSLQTATWAGIGKPVHAPTRSDWFGLYLTTAADSEPSLWKQTDGSAAGSGTLYLPPNLATGSCEFRLFSGHTNAKLATSASFVVNVTGSPATLTGPSTASANTPITLTWAGIVDPQPTDFILLADFLLQPGPPLPAYIARAVTGGLAAGSADLFIPAATPAGTYNAYLYRDAIPAYGLAEVWLGPTVTVVVDQSLVPAVSIPDPPVLAGADITASWQRITAPLPTDWLGLYAVGGTTVLAWRYTNGQATGALPFHIPANLETGSYELRLSRMTNAVLLATSPAFTITAVP